MDSRRVAYRKLVVPSFGSKRNQHKSTLSATQRPSVYAKMSGGKTCSFKCEDDLWSQHIKLVSEIKHRLTSDTVTARAEKLLR